MFRIFSILIINIFLVSSSFCQNSLDSLVPTRGLCIKAPNPQGVDRLVEFIKELGRLKVNTLVLRLGYDYKYESRPELSNVNGLDKSHVKKILSACKSAGIRLIPQVDLFGHQSWHSKLGKLLEVYPEFDETPNIKLPDKYEWPNKDTLYCKSYCPLHPKLHEVIFDIVDEIVEVFEADAFHAGLDEVFYIGHYQCIRCRGKEKARLFSGEVNKIYNHLKKSNIQLWMWGDRLIDGKTTGIGMWEASENQTHDAIDMIPKDIVINDWHYETAHPTAAYFALKGFGVVSCSWRKSDVAVDQLKQMLQYRSNSSDIVKSNFMGVMHTVWSGTEAFLDTYYGIKDDKTERGSQSECFKSLYRYISNLESK